MAVREYKCPIHGIVEQHCSIKDDIITKCPEDGCNENVERYYEPTAISWKTDGFAGKGFALTGKRTI